jgi:CRP-like cAMP-binding protein/SAM-dependent methyltransferase
MNFLDRFAPEQRETFLRAGEPMELAAGEYLIRRGDPGGDIFLVEEGKFEVVDRRPTAKVVLAVVPPGSVIGEVGFLDNSPRSADVRAVERCVVRRWRKDDLRSLLQREPLLASSFYELLARIASGRLREVSTTAVASAMGRDGSRDVGNERLKRDLDAMTDSTKEALLDAETRLRQDPTDPQTQARIRTVFDSLERDIRAVFGGMPDAGVAADAARWLGRELHPYLVRSALAERCIRRLQGATGTAEVLAHVLVDTPSGDGQLGELIDRWLLDRPTLAGLRAIRTVLAEQVVAHVPRHRNRRVLQLNAGTGSLSARLHLDLADTPTLLTVVDPSREALAFLDAGLTVKPKKVQLQTLQENFVHIAMGRSRQVPGGQDVVILHGLLEYLPDRLALSLLRVTRTWLSPDGVVLASALAPSDDQVLLDRLLGWPTIRRRPDRLLRLAERAGLSAQLASGTPDPMMLVVARAA